MPGSDRLTELAGRRAVLRHNRLDSLDADRAASPGQLAGLHKYGPMIRRQVDQGDPDALTVLPAAAVSRPVGLPSWTDYRSPRAGHQYGDGHVAGADGEIGLQRDQGSSAVVRLFEWVGVSNADKRPWTAAD
jgi:hypothetical protein